MENKDRKPSSASFFGRALTPCRNEAGISSRGDRNDHAVVFNRALFGD